VNTPKTPLELLAYLKSPRLVRVSGFRGIGTSQASFVAAATLSTDARWVTLRRIQDGTQASLPLLADLVIDDDGGGFWTNRTHVTWIDQSNPFA
jgi:hypothetical protein